MTPGLFQWRHVVSKRTRLEIYDDYPSEEIAKAIDMWIKDYKQRRILYYKLVVGHTYQKTAELVSEDVGYYVSTKTVQRQETKAEAKLFPHLEIIYHGPRSAQAKT